MLAELLFPIPLERTFHYSVPEEMELAVAPGLRARVSLRGKTTNGIILRILAEKDVDLTGVKKIKPLLEITDDAPLFEDSILAIAEKMEKNWGSPYGICAGEFFLNLPEEKYPGLKRFHGEILPQPDTMLSLPEDTDFPSREKAFGSEHIEKINHFFSNHFKTVHNLVLLPAEKQSVLFGLCAKKIVNSQVLFLVPDSSCAEAVYREMLPFFGDAIGVWHAQLTPAQKQRVLKGIISGRIRFLAGTRTAAFLPFARLRLSLIDASAEEVYRNNERLPLYNAAEVLKWRMEALGGHTFICSEFPSVENYGRAFSGRYSLTDLRENKKHPVKIESRGVEIIDMEAENFPGAILSQAAADRIQEISPYGKIAVIAPRKGYASRLFCANCGRMIRCPSCGPGMAVIKNREGLIELLCRRCGKRQEKPEKCPSCGGAVFHETGMGTQKTEAYLKKLVPEACIMRYDGDILGGSKQNREKIFQFSSSSSPSVLVATVIALRNIMPHSLDYMVFVDAGQDISSPDFRASEKLMRTIFSAKTLLKENGHLLIQTREPDNFVFSALSGNSYENFCREELETRKLFRYPPYSRLLLVRFASKNEGAVKACGRRLNEVLKKIIITKQAEIQGPVMPRGQENRKFFSEYWLVKSFSIDTAVKVLKTVSGQPKITGVKYFIVPDPQDFP